MPVLQARTIWWLFVAAIAVIAAAPTFMSGQASAQSWLPWATRETEPRRPRPARRPEPAPGYTGVPGGSQFNQPYQAPGRGSICLQLEQQLALDAQRRTNAGDTIRRMRDDLRQAERQYRRLERELDRRSCYETFLFTRSLKPSRRCHQLDRDFRQAETQVQRLSTELRDFRSGDDRSRQDEIVRALARNGCGADYQREARRRDPFTNFWQDNDGDVPQGQGNLFGGLPFATYRTLCVRLCDGYYFPVSFSTLPNHFPRDADVCQSRCAAPTELYFHQNPGGSIDQMVSQRTQQPYTMLRTAFRYRKEFVPGCSCKAAEFLPEGSAQSAAASPAPAPVPAEQDSLTPLRKSR